MYFVRQCQMVSLTGAVASNKISEVFKGEFLFVRNESIMYD